MLDVRFAFRDTLTEVGKRMEEYEEVVVDRLERAKELTEMMEQGMTAEWQVRAAEMLGLVWAKPGGPKRRASTCDHSVD